MTVEALFFDFDGVLVDSVCVKTEAFAKMYAEYGEDISRQVVEHHITNGGMSRFDKFRHYHESFLGQPLDDKELSELCARFSDMVIDKVVQSPAILGAEAFVETWKNRVPCYIVSATPESEIQRIVELRGLAGVFKEVTGSPTSKSDNLSRLLKHYRHTPEACLFFGDAISDYNAAATCGTPFIGICPDTDAALIKYAPDVRWHKNFLDVDIG